MGMNGLNDDAKKFVAMKQIRITENTDLSSLSIEQEQVCSLPHL